MQHVGEPLGDCAKPDRVGWHTFLRPQAMILAPVLCVSLRPHTVFCSQFSQCRMIAQGTQTAWSSPPAHPAHPAHHFAPPPCTTAVHHRGTVCPSICQRHQAPSQVKPTVPTQPAVSSLAMAFSHLGLYEVWSSSHHTDPSLPPFMPSPNLSSTHFDSAL